MVQVEDFNAFTAPLAELGDALPLEERGCFLFLPCLPFCNSKQDRMVFNIFTNQFPCPDSQNQHNFCINI